MKNLIISLIALAALPLVSFAASPATPPAATLGGTAIPGGSQSTPFVITKSGAYYLSADRVMTADVNAITVSAPDVTIDLNGCTLRSTGGSTGNGIEIPAVSNVEIRNGSINDIPADAIKATGGSGLRIIDVRVTTAGKSGVNSTTALTTVDRSDFSYCGSFGVYVYNVDTPRITNSNATNNGQTGICLAAVTTGEVANCHATKNQRSGISVSGNFSLVSNNVVVGNNLVKSGTDGGINLGGWSTARGNMISLNALSGIYLSGYGSILDGNNITLTSDASNNTSAGNSIKVGFGSAIFLNNHVSPSTNYVIGAATDGGGNIFF